MVNTDIVNAEKSCLKRVDFCVILAGIRLSKPRLNIWECFPLTKVPSQMAGHSLCEINNICDLFVRNAY
jgi:hypothetical protein